MDFPPSPKQKIFPDVNVFLKHVQIVLPHKQCEDFNLTTNQLFRFTLLPRTWEFFFEIRTFLSNEYALAV